MKSEKEHLKELGDVRYWKMFDRAMFCIKQDPRLVGLNKIRDELAHAAVLQATEFKRKRPWMPSKACGAPTQEMLDIREDLLPKAAMAAKA